MARVRVFVAGRRPLGASLKTAAGTWPLSVTRSGSAPMPAAAVAITSTATKVAALPHNMSGFTFQQRTPPVNCRQRGPWRPSRLTIHDIRFTRPRLIPWFYPQGARRDPSFNRILAPHGKFWVSRACVLDCGGKRSATPLSEQQLNHRIRLVIPKAPSSLRSAGAVQVKGGVTRPT